MITITIPKDTISQIISRVIIRFQAVLIKEDIQCLAPWLTHSFKLIK